MELFEGIRREHATEAQDHYRSVLRTLDTMKKEPGAEKLLQRSDLKLMYEESAHLEKMSAGTRRHSSLYRYQSGGATS